jgi:hypothetical protein
MERRGDMYRLSGKTMSVDRILKEVREGTLNYLC